MGWDSTNHTILTTWAFGIWFLSALRCIASRCWRTAPHLLSCKGWLLIHTTLAGACGCLWGAGSWIFLSETNTLDLALYGFIVAGLASGAATTSAVHRATFLAFASTAGTLLSIRMFSFTEDSAQFMSFLAFFSVLLCLRLGLVNNRLFRNAFRLRQSNIVLIRRLEHTQLALGKMNMSLEERVSERTRSLESEMQARYEAERQLRQSHRMESVGRLTGGIAHDFNNILTVMLNCLDLVDCQKANDRKMISHAKDAACRGAALTRQLLAFSRTSPCTPEVLEINQALEQIIESMLRPVLRDSISVVLERSQTNVYVQVQRSELDSALLNLVLNARDSMPQGGQVELCVCVHGQEVTVEVRDQGCGIAASDLERVFEPTFSTKGSEGTGLGLNMVRGFALRSSGDIRVESSSKGTTFYLTLPTCLAPPPEIEKAAPVTVIQGNGQTSILVVEDNLDLLHSTVRVVEGLGYVVRSANNATKAIQLLKEEKVNILLSDIRMPGSASGLDLARVVRRQSPEIEIILVTGHAPELCDSSEFCVIRKPYSIQQMAKALHAASVHSLEKPADAMLAAQME